MSSNNNDDLTKYADQVQPFIGTSEWPKQVEKAFRDWQDDWSPSSSARVSRAKREAETRYTAHQLAKAKRAAKDKEKKAAEEATKKEEEKTAGEKTGDKPDKEQQDAITEPGYVIVDHEYVVVEHDDVDALKAEQEGCDGYEVI